MVYLEHVGALLATAAEVRLIAHAAGHWADDAEGAWRQRVQAILREHLPDAQAEALVAAQLRGEAVQLVERPG